MRNLLLLCCTTILLFCSCGNELVSLNDCPTEDSEISVDVIYGGVDNNYHTYKIRKNGKEWVYNSEVLNTKNAPTTRVYFYDVNFDGYTDVIIGLDKEQCQTSKHCAKEYYIWDNDTDAFILNEGITVRPIFSPSEKAIYLVYVYEEFAQYFKNIWKDNSQEKDRASVIEVLSQDYDYNAKADDIIKGKFTLAKLSSEVHRNVAEIVCDEATGLPTEWQDVILKMKSDYNILGQREEIVQRKIREQQRQDSIAAAKDAEMKRAEEMAYKVYPTGCDDVWIDMGILSDKGETLYWATSDLIIRKDKTFGLSDFGTFGYLFGWGDIAGTTKSSDLAEYGGTNPPSSISGNPQYDIATAHLNAPARLPTKTEWMKLCENCTYKFLSIDKGEFTIGEGGLPSWVQGQWMTEARIPQIGGDALVSLSVRIAGALSSVIVTHGGQVLPIYDGVYDYSKNEDGTGELLMGKIRLLVNENGKIIVTESGYRLRKISNEGSKQYGLLLISKINGNRLFFPLPDAHQVVRDGNYAFEFQSSQENGYWSGTTHEENNREAWGFNVKGSNPVNFGLGYETRDTKKSVRPVTTTPVTVTIGTTKINEGDNEEE